MLLENEILLTVHYRGRLGAPVSHTSSKSEIEKVKSSPFERLSEDGKRAITPKNLYLAKNDYKPRNCSNVVRRTTLSSECVNYFMYGDCPAKLGQKGKDKWLKLSPKERLEWHLREMAEDNYFEYKFVID